MKGFNPPVINLSLLLKTGAFTSTILQGILLIKILEGSGDKF